MESGYNGIKRTKLMPRKAYPTDLNDKEWAVIEPYVPKPKTGGRPAEHSRREIINAIAYVLRSGCAWRLMPHDLPPWSTVYDYFRQWRIDGTWERINTALREKLRTTIGREAEPSAAIIDSQTVKTTEKGDLAVTMQVSKSRDASDIS
jgi:putative transposase